MLNLKKKIKKTKFKILTQLYLINIRTRTFSNFVETIVGLIIRVEILLQHTLKVKSKIFERVFVMF